ncbi:MAG: helix-turn-helix domain-containing protein [Fimbriimonadaceae bacterium]|jgi:DNA-binding transcriptional ArsR family regulator|nr:helix-turn-helix domain-containing protein [Fimbriimonadaceae bacterium]
MDSVILMFKALGDPTRARIFGFLCSKSSPIALDDEGNVRPVQGVTVGEVCCHITGSEQFSSTVSFHIKELRLAGLIHAEKNGKFMVCSVRREALDTLRDHINAYSDAALGLCATPIPQNSGSK